jgi:hypothetical protein
MPAVYEAICGLPSSICPFGHEREGTSEFLRGWSSRKRGCRLRAEHTPTTWGRRTLESERGSGPAGLELRGGCQFGSVRYGALVENDEAYSCHCRMCQKAFGKLFGAFFFALKDSVEWEAGSPAYYRSSKIARRGCCRECGVPHSFEDAKSGEILLTVGNLDEPERLRPVAHFGFEGTKTLELVETRSARTAFSSSHTGRQAKKRATEG